MRIEYFLKDQSMMKDVNEWAQAQFGHANLNDPRRTKRFIDRTLSVFNMSD